MAQNPQPLHILIDSAGCDKQVKIWEFLAGILTFTEQTIQFSWWLRIELLKINMSTPSLAEKLDKIKSPGLQSQKKVCCFYALPSLMRPRSRVAH